MIYNAIPCAAIAMAAGYLLGRQSEQRKHKQLRKEHNESLRKNESLIKENAGLFREFRNQGEKLDMFCKKNIELEKQLEERKFDYANLLTLHIKTLKQIADGMDAQA